jgi:tripartite-type tricarboxylate transporter receptor subunit TctC
MKIVVALLALFIAALPAAAQDWPTKPVKIVVPFGPGSTPDVVARLIADHLQKSSASRSPSTTSRARAATSAPTRWPRPRLTAPPSA